MLLAAVDFDNLHQVLRVLYDEMMPLCSNMTGVAKGIAGLGALFYVCLLYTSTFIPTNRILTARIKSMTLASPLKSSSCCIIVCF